MDRLIRINKRMAELGLCSRREADSLIESEVVTVNGRKATLGQSVSEHDVINITQTSGSTKHYLAYYKGRGIISHSPADHEIDIATRLQTDYGLRDVYPVGRLDKDSEGLMIVTNDGRLTAPLLDPANHIPKTYLVTVDKPVTDRLLRQLASGVNIEGYGTKPATTKPQSKKTFFLTLTEGKKHQIRRMCAALGYQVQALKRIQIADITLGSLKPNQYRKLTKREQQSLLALLPTPTDSERPAAA